MCQKKDKVTYFTLFLGGVPASPRKLTHASTRRVSACTYPCFPLVSLADTSTTTTTDRKKSQNARAQLQEDNGGATAATAVAAAGEAEPDRRQQPAYHRRRSRSWRRDGRNPATAPAAASGGDGDDADDETDLRPEFIGLTVVGGRVVGVDGGGGSAGGLAVPAGSNLAPSRGGVGVSAGGGGGGGGSLGCCPRQRSDQGSGSGPEKGAQGVYGREGRG